MYTTTSTATRTRRNADYYPTMEQRRGHCNRLTELNQNSDQSRQALQNFESYYYYKQQQQQQQQQQQKNSKNSSSEGGSCSSIRTSCTTAVEQQDTTTRSENFFVDQQQLRKSSLRNRPVFFLPRSIGDVNRTNSTSNTSDAPRSSTPAAPRGGPAVSTPSMSLPPPLVPESQESSYLSRNEYHQHSWKEQRDTVDENEHELLLNRLSPINILPQEERFLEGKEVGTTPQQQRQRIMREEQELIQDFLLGWQSPQQQENHDDDKEYKSNKNYLVTSSSSTTRKTSALPPCCNQDEKWHSSRRRHRGFSDYDGGAVAAPGNACYNISCNHHGEEEYTKGHYQMTCIDPNHHRTQMTRIDNQSVNISSGDCQPLPATPIMMSSTTMQGAATADSSCCCCCIPSLSSFHSSSTSCSSSPPIISGRSGVIVATTTAANDGATRICAAGARCLCPDAAAAAAIQETTPTTVIENENTDLLPASENNRQNCDEDRNDHEEYDTSRALRWDESSPQLLAHNNGDHLSSLHRSVLSGPPPSFENDHKTYSSCYRSLLSLSRPHLPSRPLVNHLSYPLQHHDPHNHERSHDHRMMSTSAIITNSNNMMIRSPKHCTSAPIKDSSLKSEINRRKDDCATNSVPGEQQNEFFMQPAKYDCLLIDIADDDKRRWIIIGGASNPKRRTTPRNVIVPNNNLMEKNHGNHHSSIDVNDTYSKRATSRHSTSNHKVQHCYEANTTQNATIPTTAYFPWTAPPDPAHDDKNYHDHDVQKQQKNKRTEANYDDIYQHDHQHRQQQQKQDNWRLKYCNLSTASSSDTCRHDGDDSSLHLSTNTNSVQSRRERGRELSSSFSSSYYHHNQHNHNSSDSGSLNDIVVPRNKKNRRVVWSSQQERRSDYSSSHQYHDHDDKHTKEQQQRGWNGGDDALALMGNTFCAAADAFVADDGRREEKYKVSGGGMIGSDHVYFWRPPLIGRNQEDHQMRMHNSSYFENNSESRSKKGQQCGISVCFERPESSMHDGLFCLSSSSEQEMNELQQNSDYALSLKAKRRRRSADYYHRH